jgi:hypothetical protein
LLGEVTVEYSDSFSIKCFVLHPSLDVAIRNLDLESDLMLQIRDYLDGKLVGKEEVVLVVNPQIREIVISLTDRHSQIRGYDEIPSDCGLDVVEEIKMPGLSKMPEFESSSDTIQSEGGYWIIGDQ